MYFNDLFFRLERRLSQNSSAIKVDTGNEMAQKITISGDILYIAQAVAGTQESDALWQVKKIDMTSDIITTWADGNTNYDNIATDLSSLTYL